MHDIIRTAPCDGVYLGDGEWISWDDFGSHDPDIPYESHLERLEDQAEMARKFPKARECDLRQFLRLKNAASEFWEETGRDLPLWGVLGELYAAVAYGLHLNRNPHAPGSDGRIGDKHVEVKTIGPRSKTDRVLVKLSGNFSHLLVVKISPEFAFAGCLITRKELTSRKTGNAGISWNRACALTLKR